MVLFQQAKSIGLSHTWKLLAPLHVLVLFLSCACIWYASFLLVLLFKFEYDSCVSCMCNLCVELYCILCGFHLALWEINGLSHFGGVICFVHLTNLKMCVHEAHHLVLTFQYYLVTMWYVIFMRNSISTMSINFSSWFYLPLVFKNKMNYHIMGE